MLLVLIAIVIFILSHTLIFNFKTLYLDITKSFYNVLLAIIALGSIFNIINKKNLEHRIKTRPKILLIHGDMDTIVPPNNLLESKDFLLRHKIDVNTKIIQNCEHNIPAQASSLALDFISKNLN